MKQIKQIRYSGGFILFNGDSFALRTEGRVGWTDLVSVKVKRDLPVSCVRVYELEPGDVAGIDTGYCVVLGQSDE
jgi:hypothetical protein